MPSFRTSDGVRLAYRDEGPGPPIVFVHGWMMSGRFFERQFEGLRERRRCVALDLRGCGDSEARAGTHTMERFGRDVAELLDHLDLREVTLVGWSMGGGVTMRYLERFGAGRLRAVGLVDFPPRFEEDPAVAEKVCSLLRQDRDAFFRPFFRRMFANELAPSDAQWMLSEIGKSDAETGCEMYRQLGAGSSRGLRFHLPAFLAFPKNGWYLKALDEWKGIFPNHIAPRFENSRHCPFFEEADAFNAALLEISGDARGPSA